MDRITGINHALVVRFGGAVAVVVDNDVDIAADDDLEGSQRRNKPHRQPSH
jgi:hypothetical protein